MRRIADAAEAKGLAVEHVLCSGDPDSLDGIYIPSLKTAYMDGTAPHIADAGLTAVDSSYLDLGRFYDLKAISAHRDELLSLKKANSLQYGKAYALLSGIGSIRRGWLGSGLRQEDIAGAEKRVIYFARAHVLFGKFYYLVIFAAKFYFAAGTAF